MFIGFTLMRRELLWRTRTGALTFAALIGAAQAASAQVELLVSNGGASGILRFDAATGAFLGHFTTAVSTPRMLALRSNGEIFVPNYAAGQAGDVLRFDSSGASLGVWAAGGLSSAAAAAFDAAGNLYVTNCGNANIVRFQANTGASLGVFATSPNGAPACATGLVFLPSGDLLVAEQNMNTIQRYHGPSGQWLGAFASGAPLASPEEMVLHNGDVYVANFVGNNVLRYNGSTGALVSTFVPTGAGGLSGPFGLKFGPDGNLYVSSYTLSAVFRFDGVSGAPLGVFASGGGLVQATGLLFKGPMASTIAYCTSSTTSIGCTPAISSTGTPSASATSGFVIGVDGVNGQRLGLIFYGVDNAGWSPLPWGGGNTSYLCVKPPSQRTGVQSSGGTIAQCDGRLALDWSAFVSANPASLGAPFASGDKLCAQAWFRDPPAPRFTNLSDALEIVLAP